ncbi:hypothetical protein Pmani_006431 [Petrolisthes manimaculis]|uniref:Uncharacterized protein n=1 Tax=Petrolisthes manimaculis TaxID=1843537 RepID=A0AAE1UFQ0_9EUCA|nr:hypothetical protein Pmani_006431 [Petrolisthes manimaculis]
MDCGSGNSRRYINVTNIVNVLEERQPGLSRALLGYHAFTGCDFTSSFYRKGKLKPLEIVEKDAAGRYLHLFTCMGEVDGDVNIEVASEFVCKMYSQPKRAQYVSILWNHANFACPDQGLSPTDYGWSANGNLLQPVWFDGPSLPDALFTDRDNNKDDSNDTCSDSDETTIVKSTDVDSDADDHIYHEPSDDEAWSEDSDTDSQDVD